MNRLNQAIDLPKFPKSTWLNTKDIQFEGGKFKVTFKQGFHGRGNKTRKTPTFSHYVLEKRDNTKTSIDDKFGITETKTFEDIKKATDDFPKMISKSRTELMRKLKS